LSGFRPSPKTQDYAKDPFFDGKGPPSFTCTYKEIKQYFGRRLSSSYAFNAVAATTAAGSLAITGQGPVPGCGAEPEDATGLMRICPAIVNCNTGTEKGDDFTRHLKLYKAVLGVAADERLYAVFDKKTVDAINALIKS